jgi:plastocyanin
MRRMLIVLALLASRTATAGGIDGVLHVPAMAASAAAPQAYTGTAGAMPGMHEVRRGLPADAVIYVDHDAAPDTASEAAPVPKLAQKDQMFVPRVVAVPVGGTVEFPNLDPIFHNVFSLSPVKRFDLGKYPRGHSKSVTFTKPGLVNVYCDIHSNMAAYVLVLPHRGFTRPDERGTFHLALPAGHYVLEAWHPDLGETHVAVDVPTTGTVTAELSY